MTKYITLNGSQFTQLHDGVVDRFDQNGLKLMLRRRLGKKLGSITGQGAVPDMVLDVIQDAEQKGWLDDFVLACAEARPGYSNFAMLIVELGLGISMETAEREALERYYKDEGSLIDWAPVGAMTNKVCQINFKTNAGESVNGTGFLLGPDVVMTNFHVVERIVNNSEANFSDVNVKFDYKLNADGATLNDGIVYKLAENPLLDSADYSDSDLVASDHAPSTAEDKLDYALLRLEKPVGCLPVHSKEGAEAIATDENRRGWIGIEANPLKPNVDAPIMIVQHPVGGVMKIAHRTKSVLEHNASNTRTRHRTATLGGSSGSPCFDIRWKLVGLHNGTDPDMGRAATYNQYVPIRAIRDLLQQRDKLNLIDQPCE